MQSTHISFDVPSGQHTLLFETGSGTLENLRFVFGGAPSVTLQQILGTASASPTINFFDPSPHEVTVFFARNPLATSNSSSFLITVTNPNNSTERLQVTALYKPTGESPIGGL